MNPHDMSAPANRIVAPGMTAEPLSLSWLLSVETHTCTQTCIHCGATSTSTPAGPLDLFLCLPACQAARPHETLRRPCDMTVTTYWCSGEHPQRRPLHPAPHIPLLFLTVDPKGEDLCFLLSLFLSPKKSRKKWTQIHSKFKSFSYLVFAKFKFEEFFLS